ncbi:MAG TPA: NnrS family protein [Candidatus Eisenbacteria bacterium]|nr:NnrS family protein [Candidatus Eisenbacteria bacterium]
MRIAPYRPLFLIGIAYALAGALLWVVAAFGLWPDAAILHPLLMIEGFEQSFVAGFLLTAVGGLTHGGPSRPAHAALLVAAQLGFGIAAFAGARAVAHGCFLFGLIVLIVVLVTRLARGRRGGHLMPEAIFIITALLLGLLGGALMLAGALRPATGWEIAGRRVVALGEVLTLVVGVGTILVPTFTGARQQLVMSLRKPDYERRDVLYPIAALMLAGALALDGVGHPEWAAVARALAATAVIVAGWRLRTAGRVARLTRVLRGAGHAIVAGLWLAALLPAHPLLGEHVVFVAGFGLLTMGIATRVVLTHGGFGIADEPALLGAPALVALGLSLALRIAAEFLAAPGHAWATSGALWTVAWIVWAARAVPRIVAPAPAGPRSQDAPRPV